MTLTLDLRDLSREQLMRLAAILGEERAAEDNSRCREMAHKYLQALDNQEESTAFLGAVHAMRKQLEEPSTAK